MYIRITSYNVPIKVFKIKLRPYTTIYHYNDRVACIKSMIRHFLSIILKECAIETEISIVSILL